MSSNAWLSCCLLVALFVLLGVKLFVIRRRGLSHAPLTPNSLALGLVYALLIGIVLVSATQRSSSTFWMWPLFFAPWTLWAGGVCAGLGLLGALLCMRSLGDAFRLGVVSQSPGALVTSGPYAISRNPFFCALFFWYLGMFILLPSPAMGLVCLAFYTLVHRQVLAEEKALRHSGGAVYEAYRLCVPRYIPLRRIFQACTRLNKAE